MHKFQVSRFCTLNAATENALSLMLSIGLHCFMAYNSASLVEYYVLQLAKYSECQLLCGFWATMACTSAADDDDDDDECDDRED